MNDNRIVLKRTNKRDAGCFLLFVFLLPYVCACLWGHVGEEMEILRRNKAGGGQTDTGYSVQVSMGWGIWEMPMEQYLVYKLESVMPEDYENEALKAQAVLLRTELVQIYQEQGGEQLRVSGSGMEKWYESHASEEELERYQRAVSETSGIYLCYEGSPVQASYFKVSNGQTRDAEEVWKTQKCPYLTGVLCVQDKAAQDYESEAAVSKANYLYQIRSQIGEGYAQQDLWENVHLTYDKAGYVTEVSFMSGEEEIGKIDGETFRYLFDLPSASFEMSREKMQMVFHVTGVGHGFGMSQYSANSRALNGETYDQILEEFFFGTELAKFE